MTFLLLQLVAGVVILVAATHFLIRLAKKISHILKISPLIVGIVVVGVGTSLPELSVSTIAALQGDGGLAIGNIIGSNIINVFLVLAFGILSSDFRIGNTKTQKSIIIMYGVTLLFIIMGTLPFSPLFSGGLLLSLAVVFSILEYRWAVEGRAHEDTVMIRHFDKEKLTAQEKFFIPALMGGIIAGGLLIVNSIEQISVISGYSTTVLGLSLTAIATSLPELFATVISKEEGEEKMAIGNLIGSNIYNILFIGGVVVLFTPGWIMTGSEVFWFLFSAAGFFVIIRYYHGRVIRKSVGISLLLLFFAYLYTLGKI